MEWHDIVVIIVIIISGILTIYGIWKTFVFITRPILRNEDTKRALSLLLALVIIALQIISIKAAPEPDRSSNIKYKNAGIGVDIVYVYLDEGYAYHNSRACRTEPNLLGVDRNSAKEITEYEALLRGFIECPDCTDRIEQ